MRPKLILRVFVLVLLSHSPAFCVRASAVSATLGLTPDQQALLDNNPGNKEATRSDGRVVVQGAGGSFPQELYNQAIFAYKFYNPDVDVSYADVGSSSARCRVANYFTECSDSDLTSPYFVDFAGSDSLVTPALYDAYPDIQMIPAVAGAVVPIFNVPGVSKLVLTPNHLSLIFLGNLTMWNDPRILEDQVSNSTRTIMANTNQPIRVVVRSGSSGTTEIFKTALASFDDGTFKSVIGTSSSPDWGPNTFTSRPGAGGVNSVIATVPYTIGYSVLGDEMRLSVGVVGFRRVRNGVVSVVFASTQTVENAVSEKGLDFGNNGDAVEHMTSDISNAQSSTAWPIAGYTYFVLRKNTMRPFSDCRNRKATSDFLLWFFTNPVPAKLAAQLGFAALPPSVQIKVTLELKTHINCENNEPAWVDPELTWPKVITSGPNDLQSVMNLYLASYESQVSNTIVPTFDSHTDWEFDHEQGVLKQDGVAFMMHDKDLEVEHNEITGTVTFPFAGFGIGLIYNLCGSDTTGCVNPELVLTPRTAAQIMSGAIQKWNHVSLVRLNPDAGLENLDLDITVVLHKQDSESTSRFALSGAEQMFSKQIRELSGMSDFEIGFTACGTSANIFYASGDVANLAHAVYGVSGSLAVYAMTNALSSSASVAKITLTESRDDAIAISVSTLEACFGHNDEEEEEEKEDEVHVPCYPIVGTVHMVVNMQPKLTESNTSTGVVVQDCDALLASVSFVNWVYTAVRYPHLHSIVGIPLESLNMVPLMSTLTRHEEHRLEMVEKLLSVSCNGESLLRQNEEKHFIDSVFLLIGLTLVGVSCVLCAMFGALLWKHRKSMALRAASPFFMAEVLLGAQFVIFSVIPLSTQDDVFSERFMDVACGSVPWLFGIGYAVMFSALCLKTWRLVKLFNNKKMKKMRIATRDLVKYQGSVVLLVIFLNLIWAVTDPFHWERETLTTNELGDVLESVGYCTCNNFGASAAPLATVLGLCTIYGVHITFKSRDLPDGFGEAKYLALAMLTIVESMVVGVPILYIAGDNATVRYFAMVFMLLVTSLGTVVIIFMPKFLTIISEEVTSMTNRYKKSTWSKSNSMKKAAPIDTTDASSILFLSRTEDDLSVADNLANTSMKRVRSNRVSPLLSVD